MNSGNSSRRFDNPLIINIKESRLLGSGLLAGHLGAAIFAVVLPLPALILSMLIGGIVASGIHVTRRHARRRGSGAVPGFEIDTDGDYFMRRDTGDWIPCRYVESFLSPWLVIVRLVPEGGRRPVSVLLAADAVAPEEFRELRARLHFQSPSAG